MAAPVVMAGLGVAPSGVQFTARPALRPPTRQGKGWAHKSASASDSQSDISVAADASLSVIEIEAKLRDRVRAKYDDIQQGFQNYDINQSLSITKGEFRRVLESFCLSLTTDQFDAIMNKVELNPNGTVRYCDFLDKFYGRERKNKAKWKGDQTRYIKPPSPQEMNTDMVEKMLKEKIQKNMKNVVKALRLYDYNRDGHVQRHELRKVLENYCFRMSDAQFDKLYQRYDFQHKGVLNYRDFLAQLGIMVDKRGQQGPGGINGSLQWQEKTSSPNKGPLLLPPTDSKLAGLSIYQIESEFRKKMKENYANLKRMFLVFDKHLDGFISIEDLKSILNQFVMPMSEQMFSQVMDRFGIKASGKVSWEFFLEKFQDPQSHGNGQTIPIKPNHKFFPIRGADEKMDIKEVVRLLHEQVVRGYSSFKQAFLEIDKNRDGRITRKELKNVLNNFKFRIPDTQFKELMFLLDPQHTNFISYHKFLDLFEEKESKEAHKWLQSCHRYNDVQKPAILAWDTIEELLCEKIAEHWAQVSEGLTRADPGHTGRVTPRELRRVVERACVPLSNEHFTNLINRLCGGPDDGGRVSYKDFLSRLGVTIKPGDLEGLSTQITQGSEDAEKIRYDDLRDRQALADQSTANRAVAMTTEEILTRLRDRMAQYSTQIRKSFTKYSLGGKGKVSKRDFRKILESIGFYLEDDQFLELCAQLRFHGGHMTYMDFVRNFEDPRLSGPSEDLRKINNHRVNKIRGDEYSMTAEEVERKLGSKLRENFENLRGAFYKFDDDHNGVVTMKNFRRMLDSFMCIMSNAEFDRFCALLGISKKTRISYKDFLEAFEQRDTAEGHKWLNSVHKYNETAPMKLMTADQVHSELATKAHQQYKDLAKAFRTMDSSGNGVITKRELKETLYKFMMPMSKIEFNKLWKYYDQAGSGTITHQDFLKHLTGDKFAPSDFHGTSEEITKNSLVTMETHHLEQQHKQEQITQNQADRAAAFKVSEVLQQLKDRMRDKYKDFQAAFKTYDKRQRGYLTAANMQKLLVDFNYYLDDDQYYDLLEKLDLSKPRSRLSYEDFLRVFEEGRADNYTAAPADAAYPQEENGQLRADDAGARLRASVGKNAGILTCAFQALDPKYTGHVDVPDFRRVLDNFCFKLSGSQFKHFMSSLEVTRDNKVDYASFLGSISDKPDGQKWLDALARQMSDADPAPLSEDEVDAHIREVVTARHSAIARALADTDYARIGAVSRDDFLIVVNRFLVRLSEDQFEQLWSRLKVNEFGNLDYQDFLRRYATGGPRPNTSAGLPTRRPGTADTDIGRNLHSSWSVPGSRGSGVGGSRPFTPMVNAEDTEKKLKAAVHKHWREIQKHCRVADGDNTGMIGHRDAKFILGRYTSDLSEDDIRKLLLKYDLRNNARFCYTDFLRHFVLRLNSNGTQTQNGRPEEERAESRLTRQKVAPAKISPPPTSVDARLQQCVTTSWKDMRRDFRRQDHQNSGVIRADDFRQTLRNYNINLSEDEFSRLIGAGGQSTDVLISYNDFIKTFLQNT